MTNDPPTKCGVLVGIKMVAAEFTTSHTTDRVDKVGPVQVFEPVLVRVVCVGTTVEIVRRRILPTFLITCILRNISVHV